MIKSELELSKEVLALTRGQVGVRVNGKEHFAELIKVLASVMKDGYKFDADKSIMFLNRNGNVKWLFFTIVSTRSGITILISSTEKEKIVRKDGTSLSNGVVCVVYNVKFPELSGVCRCFFERGIKGIERIA